MNNTIKGKIFDEIEYKSVRDSDGFITDYTLYYDRDERNYFCVFGDSDLYGPNDEHDMDFGDSLEAAMIWFNGYGEEGESDYDFYVEL